MKSTKLSLKTGFLGMMVLCWLLPIALVMSLAGYLLGKSYEESAQQEVRDRAEYAMRQVHHQLEEVIEDSKSLSYDGVVRNAYREFRETGDSAETYRTVNSYLTRKFSRRSQYQAVFLVFLDPEVRADVYLMNDSTEGFGLLQSCKDDAAVIQRVMAGEDTGIRFLTIDGRLYLARNLLDSHFEVYSTMVQLLDPQVIFESLQGMARVERCMVELDGAGFCVDCGTIVTQPEGAEKDFDVAYSSEVGGHRFRVLARLAEYDLLAENPWLLGLGATVAILIFPLLLVFISLFRRHVSRPIEMLVVAHQLVESGSRGYEIAEEAPNTEFSNLYSHFNSMSTELQNQFERSYLEQQASQRAQIKALQSQINPHFLNNTLEIINWEARLAGNDRISAMIEALSTMLGAALDRKGRSEIPLREELGYVDAYLYIIQERIGEKFLVHKQIDPDSMDRMIPRLILQPIVENAVEHDIAPRHGGNLWVRARRDRQDMVLEVEHDGEMTDTDRENVRVLLSDGSPNPRVGVQNVNQRLRLIYGSRASLQITETDHGTILARITFPAEPDYGGERSLQ